MYHIKNILGKIYFHPLFYLLVFISFITGHFRNLFYFTILIFIHELGHSLTGLLFRFKLKKIEIYPYGGCSKLEYDINTKLSKELLVLIMGPLIEVIFVYLVYYFNIDVPNYFYTYNNYILVFNLLPIYPLDGGRLLNIIFNYFISYYNSLKFTLYISYTLYLVLFFYIISTYNLIFILIIVLLGINLYKEIKKANYYYYKFLLERYLNNYSFKKIRYIVDIKNIKRDYYHYFGTLSEKEILASYFLSIDS